MPRARRVLSPAGFLVLAFLSLPVSCSREPEIHVRTGFVMGTVAELKVVSDDPARATEALDRAFAELERIQAATTSYSEDSDPARLARGEVGGEYAPVSGATDAILRLALQVAADSEGAFDPTAGALVAAWGWPEHPALPDSASVELARATVDWRGVESEAAGGSSRPPGPDGAVARAPGVLDWRLTKPGSRLDLGGIAKGWGVDRAADILARACGACLVNAGGDLMVRGLKPGGQPWRVGVQDPRDPSQLFLKLRLGEDVAVATSGDYQRYFEVDGVRYHHLLDPRTGWPARGANSATVIAPDCATADAWATAAFVLGPVAGIAALEEQPGLEGVIVGLDDAGELVLHETSGFARYRE
jgi:thiamine biosynthesis lipoprotein